MKKILLVAAIGAMLLLSGIQIVAFKTNGTGNPNTGNQDFTHTVFAEDATETTCQFCHYAREALDAIYTSQDYPFFYVCLVDDVDIHAHYRDFHDYSCWSFPTVFFDGGYNVSGGGFSENINEQMYRHCIQNCSTRTVPDIEPTLHVDWLGNADMNISIAIKNNDSNPYGCYLRIYVCEVESSMGWTDTTGHPYTFPFLDYAYNGSVTVTGGDTWTDDINWDGHNYNDGYGHYFGNIQYGNVAVIATMFNNTGHQGVYYVDDCAGFIVAGTGPNQPSNPDPKDGATGVDIHKNLSWTGGGAPGTNITYDVYFGTTNPPVLVVHNQSATIYHPGTMNYETTHYWKIVAWDQNANTSAGPVWSFTTMQTANQPPAAPTITGPSQGKPKTQYIFTFTTSDPDANDQVYVYVDWGDNTTSDWVGPHTSGATFIINHEWTSKGTYTVKAKAKDDHGAESDWSTLTVQMPTAYMNFYPLLQWLLERFPNVFPILRHLMGY